MKNFKFVCLFFCLFSGSVFAAGIPVVDTSNLTQNIVTALQSVDQTTKQIEQYTLQLQQYENMLKNTAAPATLIWDKAQETMGNILRLQKQVDNYYSQIGNIDAYLESMKTPDYWRGQEYYRLQTEAIEREAKMNKARVAANQDLIASMASQREQLAKDAANLASLQNNAASADGYFSGIQASNQMLAANQAQLLQIKAVLVSQGEAMAHQLAIQQEKDTHQRAFEDWYKEKFVGKVEEPEYGFIK